MNWSGVSAFYVAVAYAVALIAMGIEVVTLWRRASNRRREE
jgi:heme exporter protein D